MSKTTPAQNASAVINNTAQASTIFNGINLPDPAGKKGPKLETCEVGPFRLKGIKIDTEQFTADEYKEMVAWAKDNNAYVVVDRGLFSWKSEAKRDWFILRWS